MRVCVRLSTHLGHADTQHGGDVIQRRLPARQVAGAMQAQLQPLQPLRRVGRGLGRSVALCRQPRLELAQRRIGASGCFLLS